MYRRKEMEKMKKINKEVFKKMLKENRETISSFSRDIGISRDTLNNWINREGNIPEWKCEIIEEYLKEKYGYSPEDLFYKEQIRKAIRRNWD